MLIMNIKCNSMKILISHVLHQNDAEVHNTLSQVQRLISTISYHNEPPPFQHDQALRVRYREGVDTVLAVNVCCLQSTTQEAVDCSSPDELVLSLRKFPIFELSRRLRSLVFEARSKLRSQLKLRARISAKTLSMLALSLALVSRYPQACSSAAIWASSTVTCLVSSRSFLFPTRMIGVLVLPVKTDTEWWIKNPAKSPDHGDWVLGRHAHLWWNLSCAVGVGRDRRIVDCWSRRQQRMHYHTGCWVAAWQEIGDNRLCQQFQCSGILHLERAKEIIICNCFLIKFLIG